MSLGPGKYDSLCTYVRENSEAHGVLLIVMNGNLGHGFSVQATPEITVGIPSILRLVADDIERSLKQGGPC